MNRYVIIWRKPPPNQIDWDFYFAMDLDEVDQVIANLVKQGVFQYSTYTVGEKITEKSKFVG